jgi:hypothetical protein
MKWRLGAARLKILKIGNRLSADSKFQQMERQLRPPAII